MRYFLTFLSAAFWWAGVANADMNDIRVAIDSNQNERALALLEADPNRDTGEGLHLAAIARARLAAFEATQSDDKEWPASDKEVVQSLLQEAVSLGYGPARIDLAGFISTDSQNLQNDQVAILLPAFREGDIAVAAMLFHEYCSGHSVPGLGASDVITRAHDIAYSSARDKKDTKRRSIYLDVPRSDGAFAATLVARYAQSLVTGDCFAARPSEGKKLLEELLMDADYQSAALNTIKEIGWLFEGSFVADETLLPVAENRSKAVTWLEYVVQNDLADQFDYSGLAEYLTEGLYVARDLARAKLLYVKCYQVSEGASYDFCSSYTLKEALFDIVDEPQSSAEAKIAFLWLTEIAERDQSSLAFFRLAATLEERASADQAAMQQVLELYKKSAALGDSDAAFQVGYILVNGQGVRKDAVTARRYFSEAAEAGNVVALYNLGIMYRDGEGVDTDPVVAAEYVRRSAEAGYASAQSEYGRMIANGEGVLENDVLAVQWFRKAAEQNEKYGQFNLAFRFATGEGVRQDSVEAYKWANLSAAQGHDGAIRLKEILAEDMSAEQIARAQRLSAAWVPGSQEPARSLPPPPSSGDKRSGPDPALVQSVQRGLLSLGYYQGPVDGIVGPKTSAAVSAFKASYGLGANDQIDPSLAIDIGKALARSNEASSDEMFGASDVASTGTAFMVSVSGDLVTNAHVVSGCSRLTLKDGTLLTLQAFDQASDLALLRSSRLSGREALRLRSGRGVRLADTIMVAGFPLTGIVSPDVNITIGNVSSLTGPNGDRGLLQITAPVQVGNSGGPIVDDTGMVVGVVVSKLDAIKVASATGDIPQNVNFGISLGTVQSFLDSNSVDYEVGGASTKQENASIAAKLQKTTYQIECH